VAGVHGGLFRRGEASGARVDGEWRIYGEAREEVAMVSMATDQEDKAGREEKFSLLEREAWWVLCVDERINMGERDVAAKFWSGAAGPLCWWPPAVANFWSGVVGPPCQ
jgi:hypothetical protein